ncbi:MAG: zeta toxin family protein [Synergistaceae bacterium]|nr:zeta toxin family protein [Synergistaceae bacterium]
MPEDKENLSQIHEEQRRIFDELKRQQISERKTSAKPKAIILCGQPGSGRGSQIPIVMQEISDSRAVLIDKDQTQGDTQRLFNEALREKSNLVIKATLPNDEMLKKLREEGYSSSVYVVSAHERESLLSLYQKYEGQLATRGIGNKPKLVEHDEIYSKLPETLQHIEEEGLSDEIIIRDRKCNEIYRNHQVNGIWEKESQSSEALEASRNRAWTAEEISNYQDDWQKVIESMYARGASPKEIDEAERVRDRCLKSIMRLSPEKIAELNKVEENEIESAVSLLKNPRSLDNSSFRGYESSPQQNDTLDMLDQIKKNVQESKTALEKLKQAGLSADKDITKNKIVSPGQFPNVKGAEVISRTKDTLTLVKGRSLFIYELKRLELKAPALGQPGEKLDLRWPSGQEKARGTIALEREQHHSRVRSQNEAMK